MNTRDHAVTSAAGASRWRTSPFVHFVYLIVPVLGPISDPQASPWDWVLVAGIITTTVFLHVFVYLRPVRARWWLTVPMTMLGAAATTFNSGAAILFVYAAASAGISESRRDALRWFVGLTVLVISLSLISSVPFPSRLWGVIPPVLFIWITGAIQVEEAERRRDAAELRLRNARIEHLATVSERERIARDLHDLLGHSLTAVVMRAQLTKELVSTDPARARAEATEIERTARDALAEIRKAVNGWRQASLEAELESARKTLASAGVDLIVRRDASLVLVGSTEHELALALREAITNVVRHAKARTCHVGIDAHAGELRLVIADDGVGSTAREGNGLAGVRERITALGGQVQRNGATGMTVTIAVPLQVAT